MHLPRLLPVLAAALLLLAPVSLVRADGTVLTPKPGPAPRVNGPAIFGVRPDSPFLYTIPATGTPPLQFSVDRLPDGLKVDATTGRITGALSQGGTYEVVLVATNAVGRSEKPFRIVVGDKISLTPAMGWNSWNCWAGAVDQDKVLRSAKAIVSSGLAAHGWTYVNIDDTWQGQRTGKDHALEANAKFPDMKKLCDDIHAMGLKAGIYSTPWVTSYAGFAGGSADTADGSWVKPKEGEGDKGHRHGAVPFASADANEWAAWGMDYLKYDWNPIDVPHTAEMSQALRDSGRDIVYSLSNAAPHEHAADWARLANSWRTTGDIFDHWDNGDAAWQYGVSEIGFAQDKWVPFAGPGHWNDPDMLVVGWVGWGPELHQTHLTPDEQYTHISMWCMLSAPLLIGCDLDRLDDFTLGLLTNDEVLAVDQDALGQQALRIATIDAVDVYRKQLEDGSVAVGFFNRGEQQTIKFNKTGLFGVKFPLTVRDLWRQQDIATLARYGRDPLVLTIPAHGVVLVKVTPAP
jgi:alpha-galactosidase